MTATLLQTRFGGIIRNGKHDENGQCCILEYRSACMGIPWTDDPVLTRTFDIRPINDSPWSSDQLRTEWMLKLEAVVGGSLDWPAERQLEVATKIVLASVRQIVSALPGLPVKIEQQCEKVTTLEEAARAAAEAARAAGWAAGAAAEAARVAGWAAGVAAEAAETAGWAAEAAAEAAEAAAETARAAGWAAEAAARDQVLILACQIWIDAAS